MAEIVVLRNREIISRTALDEREVQVGRLADSDIVIPSGRVSRRHARVFRRDDTFIFEDCDSANGCYLGRERVREHRLAHGDAIRIAGYDLLFQADGSDPPGSEPATDEGPQASQALASGDWSFLRSALLDPAAARKDTDRLQALFEISRTLDGASDFDSVLRQIMDRAIRVMGGERGLLTLVDADGELRVRVARSLEGDISDVDQETVSRSLMQQVLETGRPMVIFDAQSEEWGSKSVLEHSIHSAICAPLMTRDAVSGIIYVDHRKRPRAFTEQDLAFFTTFAIQAKVAIDSSRAYWELVESLFQASEDFVVVCSPTGEVTQLNRAAARLIGRSAETLQARHLADLMVAEDRDRAVALCRETILRGVVPGEELGLAASAGRVIPLSISGFALRDRSGSPIGQCFIGRDLSEVRQLIAQLELRNRFIRKTFGRYLSDEIVTDLLSSPEGLKLGGEKRKVTIMMTDLRGFTSLCERLPGEQVVRLLNHYLGAMVDVITRYQGTIDEFIGDAILAIFGAPTQRQDDAVRASACAIEMQLAMRAVNAWNAAQALPRLEMGIALNTGEVVVGNIGSQKRSKYAVVGRQVNLTARIESHTVGGQILIRDSTLAEAPEDLVVGERSELALKGIEEHITVYEMLSVGAPHHLSLEPPRNDLVDLASPLRLGYRELEGSAVSDRLSAATLVRLGERGAELRSATRPSRFGNLKLLVPAGGKKTIDVYCKVTTIVDLDEPGFRVRFTSVPPEAEDVFHRLKAQRRKGNS